MVIPTYNHAPYLATAINSVIAQTYDNWELIISDNASTDNTKNILEHYQDNPKIKINFNSRNLGMFANLNLAIEHSSGDYIIILCSDDLLLPTCLETNLNLLEQYPEAKLGVGSFKLINYAGEYIPSNLVYFYEQIAGGSQVFSPQESLALLLQHGSINQGLTRIFFKKELYQQVGLFNESWRHAGDWEWVYRATRYSPIVISGTPVAAIRAHSGQQSGVNFQNLTTSLEVAEMVKILLADPDISQIDAANRWASHLMQFQLWHALKFAMKGNFAKALTVAKAVHQTTGLPNTIMAMISWLPERWQVYHHKIYPHA
ncbi:glycosyltransferase [[Phormidium] sp. ETS-05]|uniref:glycosyltransferase n=1 Tax=[Phormidium] sp. ETS-05 TaxID=222819 RepID=UPI0018EF2F05|nr:glycosyltransferase [[Phormidium] sp. ETS-05]